MQNRKLFFFLLGMIVVSVARGQQIDSILSIYHDRFQQEKLHLHFDKTVYNRGETIWFKAYILAGDSLSDYSRNFYVDWYDNSGRLMAHTIHPVFESSARGQFEVPKNYAGETLHLKAYTQWMLNFDSAFLYTKNIGITQADSLNKNVAIQPSAVIHFFPEGGDLLSGVNSTVAFMANDQSGKPVSVKGALFNSANVLIDSFASVHDGMGKFSIEPSANENYTCKWIDEYGINHTNNLPFIKNSGAAIEAQVLNDKAVFVVKRTAVVTDNFKALHLVATINQQLVYKASINLSTKKMVSGSIPVTNLQTGILQLTLFDANWIPVAERVLFVNNGLHEFFPELNLVSKRLTKRGKNVMELYVPDTVLSNLSISVTDANVYSDSSSNIFSQLLLADDLKGYIHNASYYFSGTADSIVQHLDLVMLTHGWRRYKWEDIIAGKLPVPAYPMDSDYLQIKGKIYTDGQVRIRPNQTMSLIMQAKDSSRQYFSLPVNSDGSFRQRGVIFFDTTKVFYQLNGDKRLNSIATANFQYSLPLVPFAKKIKLLPADIPDNLKLRNNNSFYDGIQKTRKNLDSAVILKEVIVQSKIKSQVELLDEKYATGIFNSNNAYAFDIINDERAKGSLDIFHYLQNMVPGLNMSIPVLGANGATDANSNNVPGLTWRDGSPDIFLNEMPSDAQALMNIQMSDIAYIKVFRPPFMAASGSGASGAIAVYTRKNGDANYDRVRGLNSAILTGYSAYKEFYSPDYSTVQTKYPDLRATLYWNPYVLTDKKNRKAKLEFYNNDLSKKIRIIVEGVNASGKLARIEKVVQ